MNMTTTKNEEEKIKSIMKKVCNENPDYDRLTIMMDLTACHLNGCPLDLDRMVDAEHSHLLHDILGINENICHETGQLKNHFLPRFSA